MKKQRHEQWYLGFLGLFFLIGVRELTQGDASLLDAVWLVWIAWFTYFIPIKKPGSTPHMKTLKCDLCEHTAQGDTFEAWMEAMKPHYAEAHKDFMQKQSEKPREEQMKEMQRWMTENKARFDSQSEDS